MRHSLIENYLLACAVFIMSAVMQFPVTAQDTESDECLCDPSLFLHNYATAERIFKGQILSGHLDDEAATVAFEVGVISTVRGKEQSHIKLSTSLSQRCPIDVYAGTEMVFILGAGDRSVSRCDLPVGHHNQFSGLLIKAFAFVEYYDVNRAKARSVLVDELVPGADASKLQSILEMAYRIDPTGPVFDSSTTLGYRNFEVTIKNDKVVSHVWR